MSALDLVRPELRDFTLYEAADSDAGAVRLHANELPWRAAAEDSARGVNRYPEPRPSRLRKRMATRYGVEAGQLLATRGSDDGIDLLVRTFCRAGQDRVLTCPPCFAMYAASARLQGCAVDRVELTRDTDFAFDSSRLLAAVTPTTKLVFLCSPNNPTGGALAVAALGRVCAALAGRALVVVDEAYAEFSSVPSALALLWDYPNLVVLRTLSKAYGLAGLRVGSVIAGDDIVAILSRIMTPYPLPSACVDIALETLSDTNLVRLEQRWQTLLRERARVGDVLATLPTVLRQWPSEGNFLLVQCRDARLAASAARGGGYLIRAMGGTLDDCVRITIGTPAQNDGLLDILRGLRP